MESLATNSGELVQAWMSATGNWTKTRLRPVAVALILATFSWSSAALERTIDIRDCPLDTTTFVDPWSKGTFSVSRVGTRYEYNCNGVSTKEEIRGEICHGPFGDLILVGELKKYGDSGTETAAAVWSVIWGSPCCHWHNEQISAISFEGVTWLSRDETPTIGELPFASIESSEDDTIEFGNEKLAATCKLRH
tara:strand:- start:317 stop:895 length:579 start_codon:yes stop_codon:yes gene_type:complete